ncbi:MAG: succinate dehydrogenase, cytochrome b556 subunit [Chloroflexi bacterium]|nr:MAG: succinate dehydrogenase, cytochrome b556 subunit [Chloroflexota bacterium]
MSAVTAGLREYLAYRGREGMWAWILHRITGLGVMFFLIWHILDIFLMALGAEEFNRFLVIYKAAPFRILEIFLVFSVIFHAFNGARVILLDFVPSAMDYEAELFWVVLGAALVIWAPAALAMLAPLVGIHIL